MDQHKRVVVRRSPEEWRRARGGWQREAAASPHVAHVQLGIAVGPFGTAARALLRIRASVPEVLAGAAALGVQATAVRQRYPRREQRDNGQSDVGLHADRPLPPAPPGVP